MILQQPKVERIEIDQLKSIVDLSLELDRCPLTGIMGSNRSGKTTVLHALACAFSPATPGSSDYRFPTFFRPNTESLWKDSRFRIAYGGRLGEATFAGLTQEYKKEADRWTPRYGNRPLRFVKFVGIADSAPDLETIALSSMIHYTKKSREEKHDIEVRELAGKVLNENYSGYFGVSYQYRNRQSIGVSTKQASYSALSMSSGEQRVFRVLDTVVNSPDYALVLIDEIDLFLHQDALQRLLAILHDHCKKRHKQLIFTTHFPPSGRLYDSIDLHSIHRGPTRTLSWRGYSLEALRHITGAQVRPLTVYTEDDLGERVVAQVASELGLRKYVETATFGPADNAATLVAGLHAAMPTADNYLALTDGDVLGARGSIRARVRKIWSGNSAKHEDERKRIVSKIRSFRSFMREESGNAACPEVCIHAMVCEVDPLKIPPTLRDFAELCRSIVHPLDRHGFLNDVVDLSGENRSVAISKLVDIAAASPLWSRYTRVLRAWLRKKKVQLAL
ncbi:AAA family ATPase [Pseudomarimonas salicorniae]|uniref:ATP-binding protein n=1 Tax=Pseudomarimonas salicorniae TaxID=2933270 RepID=A0ABT0GLL3_9GAMM|nr:ATP-binding protein [Lysobacter sp. CAU 1642]